MMIFLQLCGVLACIIAEAFYSGMETGVISIRQLRLRHRIKKGERSAAILSYFLDEPDRLLGTTLVGTNLCVVIASVLSASAATTLLGPAGKLVSTLVLSVILLLFAEYIPKAWFRARPYVRCARFALPLRWSWSVFRPVGLFVTWLAGLVIPGDESTRDELHALANRDELKILTAEGEKHGVFTPEERDMIHRTVELAEKPAGKIMMPLDRVAAASLDASIEAFLALARETDFMRYPVRDETTGAFVGTIDVFDVLAAEDRASETVEPFVKPPVWVHHDTAAAEIMPILRLARQTMGLVIDDSRKVIGLVTTEDLLMQIVPQ